MTRPIHFYHVWADGAWESPLREHVALLKASRFAGEFYVGVVGTPENRKSVIAALPVHTLVAEAETGFEQVTLKALQSWVAEPDPQTPVLYTHAKGAGVPDPYHDRWRYAMDSRLLFYWRDHVKSLASVDAIGSHWLEPGVDYNLGDFEYRIDTPFFGGNFWWASAGYLAKLPPVRNSSRYDAESWIGLGNPRVLDLAPGWPVY